MMETKNVIKQAHAQGQLAQGDTYFGKPVPRVGRDDVRAEIKEIQYYRFPDSVVTVCCITTRNGFYVVGKSMCQHPSMFNEELGRTFAKEDAEEQILEHLVYQMKQRIMCFGQ